MSLVIDDFIQHVKNEIDERIQTYSFLEQSENQAFAQWAIELIFKTVDSDEAFNLLVLERMDRGMAYYKDDNNGVFYILQAYYDQNPKSKSFGQSVVYSLLETREELRQNSHPNIALSKELHKALSEGYSFASVLIVFWSFDSSVDISKIRQERDLSGNELILYDLNELRRISAGWDTTDQKREIVLQFLTSASLYPGEIDAAIASVDAQVFKQAISEHVPYIYDNNLRVPLGATRINEEMEETLKSSRSSMFWYFNNGITMLCNSFTFTDDGNKTVIIKEPRIVNGAQTTDALLSVDLTNKTDIAIMLRIIAAIPGSEQTKSPSSKNVSFLQDLCLDIAKYTNSQNPVQVPDFRSNEDIHKQLHEKFSKLGWFYEHRRGQWTNESNKQPYRGANGSYKKLTMMELAQEWLAFAGEPALAIREKYTLFEAKGKYVKIFMRFRSAEEYLVAHMLFSQIEEFLKDNLKKAKTEERNTNQQISITSRYYLAIGKATRRVAAHMTALIGIILEENYGALTQSTAKKLIPVIQSYEFIKNTYPDLQDTLFRLIERLSKDPNTNLHSFLSDDKSLEILRTEIFDLVIQMEKARGRSIYILSLNL